MDDQQASRWLFSRKRCGSGHLPIQDHLWRCGHVLCPNPCAGVCGDGPTLLPVLAWESGCGSDGNCHGRGLSGFGVHLGLRAAMVKHDEDGRGDGEIDEQDDQ